MGGPERWCRAFSFLGMCGFFFRAPTACCPMRAPARAAHAPRASGEPPPPVQTLPYCSYTTVTGA